MVDAENRMYALENHILTSKCFDMSVPTGWIELIENFIDYLDDLNVRFKTFLGIVQIKTKFGKLVIYLEDYMRHDWNHRISPDDDEAAQKALTEALKEISKYSEKASKICRTCGKQKVETVINSEVTSVCFDHFKHPSKHWIKTC